MKELIEFCRSYAQENPTAFMLIMITTFVIFRDAIAKHVGEAVKAKIALIKGVAAGPAASVSVNGRPGGGGLPDIELLHPKTVVYYPEMLKGVIAYTDPAREKARLLATIQYHRERCEEVVINLSESHGGTAAFYSVFLDVMYETISLNNVSLLVVFPRPEHCQQDMIFLRQQIERRVITSQSQTVLTKVDERFKPNGSIRHIEHVVDTDNDDDGGCEPGRGHSA